MRKSGVGLAVKLVLIAAGMSIGAAAMAAEELEEVTVEAKPIPSRNIVGRTHSGLPIEQVTLDHHVSYADLDLVTHAGAMELHSRVQKAAKEACDQLDMVFPTQAAMARECTAQAIHDAADQVQNAIAAAAHKHERAKTD
jgi:UrcA family protein